MTDQMHYELRLANTSSGVGYFACVPSLQASFDAYLEYLRGCPWDDFMHKHLLDMICGVDEETLRSILDVARDRDPIMVTLIHEASLAMDKFAPLRTLFSREVTTGLLPYSPLVSLKSSLLDDQEVHRRWCDLFGANLGQHRELPDPISAGLPFAYSEATLGTVPQTGVPIEKVCEERGHRPGRDGVGLPSAEETAGRALERLEAIGAFAGNEMRHVSSLSPYGFYRKWHLKLEVKNGRHDYTVTGIQTSYGKGLTEAGGRASYSMEMVERVSSFASFGPDGVLGYAQDYPLVHGSFSALEGDGRRALAPNSVRLEVPYGDEPLYWLEGRERTRAGLSLVLIPAQSVFLFCNLDEISLFSGLGSTGLASGNTMEQAKVSALLEVLERDCEATTLHDPARCFQLEAADSLVASLLSECAAKGLCVRFQDLTGSLGVPCYKCFVMNAQGEIIKGTGAHLDGRRAVISALTETPHAPHGPSVRPSAARDEATVRFEDLPNFSADDPAADLEILESLLLSNGLQIFYVDLTRQDLDIPVVKAIVPGLELMADFDEYSRVSPRLFAGYLRQFGRL
ncbi:MAG: YcaO-like family protein [Syntrophobacteraceae bacterium]